MCFTICLNLNSEAQIGGGNHSQFVFIPDRHVNRFSVRADGNHIRTLAQGRGFNYFPAGGVDHRYLV